ncbi:DUF924 domain-containing protein [Acetobacteraceae bacterium]|nr:DUF924 domain-containing protein [Candidatus Parcubacteria bacterium]
MKPEDVIRFWFEESSPHQWFKKDDAFDQNIKAKFQGAYNDIVEGKTHSWRTTPEGRLAEVVVLDQFSRNMFRNTPKAFEHDVLALRLAEEAVAAGDDKKLPAKLRKFLYMPFMHSESPQAHTKAIWLFLSLFDFGTLFYEFKHKRIIDRFGRYPHRNKILGRVSTPQEEEFLKTHKGF